MQSKITKVIWGAALLGLLAFVVLIAITFGSAPSAKMPGPMPNPNGYDALLASGGSVRLQPLSEGTLGSPEILAELVRANAPALVNARQGLSQECLVRIDPAQPAAAVEKVGSFKTLAQAFELEGRLALFEGRTNDFVDSTLCVARLAQKSTRGGLLIHALIGASIGKLAMNSLESNIDGFDADACARAARELEELESTREPFSAFRTREKEFARQSQGFRGQIALLVMRSSLNKTMAAGEAKVMQNLIHSRITMLRLAQRAFELEHGRKPTSSQELVPKYLRSVPMDPATQSPLRSQP